MAALLLTAFVLVVPPYAHAEFGIARADVSFEEAGGLAASRAGSHPGGWSTTLAMSEGSDPIRTLRVRLPPGVVGALGILPRCARADFDGESCPPATEIGTLEGVIEGLGAVEVPLHNLAPSPGSTGEFALSTQGITAFIKLTIAAVPPHNVIATVANLPLGFAEVTLRIDTTVAGSSFLTMPRACTPALSVRFEAQSATDLEQWVSATATTHDNASLPNPLGLSGCELLAYAPTLDLRPTSVAPVSPSGLDLTLDAPDPGFTAATGFARADTAASLLTFPLGMTVNPSVAAGLASCDPAQLAAESPDSVQSLAGEGCPLAAKLGSAEVKTALIDEEIPGAVYVATPDDPTTTKPGAENPFDSLLALFLVLREPERGILISIPVEVEADPDSGRLTARIEQLPQLPISSLDLHLRDGPRAPLTTPSACGEHQISYRLTPSSGGASRSGQSTFATRPCPAQTFAPKLSAGTISAAAGRASPFVLELQRSDADDDLSRFSVKLPPGLAADLNAVPLCPQADAVAGACPAGSKVGFARIAIGSRSQPLWVPPGEDPTSAVNLAGPYQGAPYSLVIVVPAQAGPYELGTVVTRAALRVDPDTARAAVELDPLPQIIAGVPLHYRAIRLVLDRPGFIRNPTSCASSRITASATATSGASAEVGDFFGVADCAALGLRPRLRLRLSGGLERNSHPSVALDLEPRPGDANLRDVDLTLPEGLFVDPSRLRQGCTRRLFASHQCPPSARLGWLELKSPLLPSTQRGRIFLLEGERRLPDLAADLPGEVDLFLRGHLDARHARLRAGFDAIPDLPLSSLHLVLKGGFRGILVNSEGLCGSGPPRASATFRGHNGKSRRTRPRVAVKCPR